MPVSSSKETVLNSMHAPRKPPINRNTAGRLMSRAWYSGQHSRQAQQIPCLMLRLVEQQAMETVCSHALVVPVGDGVDVRVPERLERDAAAPMDPDSIDAFEARAEKHEDASDRCRPRAADEVPDEEIPERRERQRRPECVDEEDLIGCWRAAERTVLSGRQQVHQPVVVEVVVQVIRIPRRHVAFASSATTATSQTKSAVK